MLCFLDAPLKKEVMRHYKGLRIWIHAIPQLSPFPVKVAYQSLISLNKPKNSGELSGKMSLLFSLFFLFL